MTQLANEASVTPEATVPASSAHVRTQQWLGYVSPVVQRFTGAVLETRSALEKRLGFCPLKEAAKGASHGLDVLANGLHRAASQLRTLAGVAAAEGVESSASSPQAQA